MKYLRLFAIVSFYVFSLAFLPDLLSESLIENDLRHDASLVAPGTGSNTVVIGDTIDSVIQKRGRERFKISKLSMMGELFKDIFHIGNKLKVYFTALYYNENDNYSLCVNNGHIVAVIGLTDSVTTVDGVSLKAGINNFIFNYGNNNIVRLKRGSHGLYAYPSLGIAVIDDDLNDTIDLYIIFAPQPGD
jgi:hypothetical protein